MYHLHTFFFPYRQGLPQEIVKVLTCFSFSLVYLALDSWELLAENLGDFPVVLLQLFRYYPGFVLQTEVYLPQAAIVEKYFFMISLTL